MLGDVFDGQVEKAGAAVGASIATNHQQLRCSRSVPFAPSTVLAGECRINESANSLPLGAFLIYHLFLVL